MLRDMSSPRRSSSTPLPLALLISSLVVAAPIGCATSDHGRLNNKIESYESRAASYKAKLATTNDPARRVRYLNTLIELTDTQIALANRVNPQTNPGVAAGTITIEDARKEKEAAIERYKGIRADYVKQRDAITNAPAPAGK